jgi:hypothetical protein
MAKKQQKKTWPRKKIIKRVLLVLLVALVGFLVVRTVVHYFQTEARYRQDKVRFAETEKDLDRAYNAIVATVGKPYQTKKTHVCSYGALKFSRGPLSCAVAYQLIYGTENTETGKQLTAAIYSTVRSEFNFKVEDAYQSPHLFENVKSSFTAEFDHGYKFDCGLDYSLRDRQWFNETTSEAYDYKEYTGAMPNVAEYSLGCNKYTPKALYPIEGN